MMDKIQRFAGSSGGALIACLASIGMTAAELRAACDVDFAKKVHGRQPHLYHHVLAVMYKEVSRR